MRVNTVSITSPEIHPLNTYIQVNEDLVSVFAFALRNSKAYFQVDIRHLLTHKTLRSSPARSDSVGSRQNVTSVLGDSGRGTMVQILSVAL